ncbi:hypothetical protein [Rhizorhapis sp. SPR117]|uniref:hypothetical protein n=1 Tax=Rhizorhapis sp. SPR117 TaxID=2912611 RepID=UPI001F186318|nr:hypothetical protein [Rhizorhapis sp. SPR117]
MNSRVDAPIAERAAGMDEGSVGLARSTIAPVSGLSLATLLPSLATSIANAALPALAQSFTAWFQAARWILLAYLLAITAMIVMAGTVGDRSAAVDCCWPGSGYSQARRSCAGPRPR